MVSKGENTKQFIISESQKLFAEKGYSKITMKDICEVCQMSRGGLYRHFSSTKEIFIAMLDQDLEDNKVIVENAIDNNIPAEFIFDGFLKQEEAAIMSSMRGLYFAIHEFAFIEIDQRQYFKDRLSRAIEILVLIFDYGQKTGVFKSFEKEVLATHMLYVLDSLKATSPIFEPDQDMIRRQINFLKELVL